MEGNSAPTVPATLPVLVIRNRVLFPGGLLRLSVGKPRSVRLVEEFLFSQKRFDVAPRPGQGFTPRASTLIGVFALRPGESEEGPEAAEEKVGAASAEVVPADALPGGPPIFAIGCAARVVQVARASTPEYFQFSILVQGVCRIRAEGMTQLDPYYVAPVTRLDDILAKGADVKVQALALNLREATQELIKAIRGRSSTGAANGPRPTGSAFLPSVREVTESLQNASPATLADVIISHLNVPLQEKQAILEERKLEARLLRALELIKEQVEVISLSSKITSEVEGKILNRQREAFLRQQMKAIREELGDEEDGQEEDEMAQLATKVKKTDLPDDVRSVAEKELRRLKKMQPSQPEFTVIRHYMDWLLDMPWTLSKEEQQATIDVHAVEDSLERDHYGLAKVKRRIVEYMAVRSLKRDLKGPILCLVGPPGVGKTSLGRSIAASLGRKFQRLSLGGVHDEAEIRGHRRTYIGAMPGSIVQCIKKAGSRSPVLLLDEIDKLGTSARGGDPASALLEVLDPEQNSTFTDHYLNVAFDLSGVFFLATANQTDTIPEALLDRMEIIQLPGYTLEEKTHIARQYLIPKQLEANGLEERHLVVTPSAIQRIINGYTREAGVRQAERELAAVCRHVALKLATAKANHHASLGHTSQRAEDGEDVASSAVEEPPFQRVVVTADLVGDVLGPIKYESEVAARMGVPGVCTGLAWKPSGGELLFIECSTVSGGRGSLTITGKLGEVMKESATIALSFVRAKLPDISHLLGSCRAELSASTDVHIHVPAGAIPKDGPSAGVAIAVALVSHLTGRRVYPTLAMTGEITLRGLVLPVGGIKEKVLAAHRGGITHVILPHRNVKDIDDLPPKVRQDVKFTLARTVMDVLEVAFEREQEGSDITSSTPPTLPWPHHQHINQPLTAYGQPGSGGAMLMDRCGPLMRSAL